MARRAAIVKLIRLLIALGLAGVLVGVAGFLVFADWVVELVPHPEPRADAIVVLTGDEERIATGVRLLVEGRARRLLISGVHPSTRMPTEMKRRIHGNDATRQALVRCCIDIGHEALNTSGNADEAERWARTNGFRSLIVVTSNYHMPRSQIEFTRAMPDVRLLPHPVAAGRNVQLGEWWRHWPSARVLLAEYVKTLGSGARLAVARLMSHDESPPQGPTPPGSLPSASASARTGQ
jgi:uncharacterized SAM-binding protein YcdF (DUF218 family)